jgi:GTP-binding protein HflX
LTFHPEFEDHIASVNQTLMDIKARQASNYFNKIDAYSHLTIDEDDLMTENTKTQYTLSGSPLGWVE